MTKGGYQTMRLRIRTAAAVLALALAGAGLAWAAAESNNTGIAADATGGTVTFTGAKHEVLFRNTGAQDVSVRVYSGTETVAIHTHAASGSWVIPAGELFNWPFDAGHDGGIGLIGFSHRCAAGQSTTLKWIAK
jgi:hypothetical protein